LPAIEKLRQRTPIDRTIEVPAKGGRMVSAHIPEALLAATEKYIETERVLAASRSGKPVEHALFLNGQGQPLTGKAFYRALKRASRRLKFSTHPHQARTSFATHVRDRLEGLNREGLKLDAVKVVQSILAHADARTTEQYLESIDVPSLDVLGILGQLAAEATRKELA
jgi:site-specific recombinase XerD